MERSSESSRAISRSSSPEASKPRSHSSSTH
jgi:hypothetical protein